MCFHKKNPLHYQGYKVISCCFLNQNFYQFYHLLPVFIFPDAEPFNQILGALEFGVKAIFLAFESGHILHRHAEKELNKSNR